MIALSEFKLDKQAIDIFQNNNWDSSQQILLYLEAYKFVKRNEILLLLRSKSSEVYQDISKLNRENLTNEESEGFKVIEQRYGVLLEKVDSVNTRVICSATHDLNQNGLKIDVNASRISIVYVTPLNFLELKGEMFNDWDYLALMKTIVLDCMRRKGTDVHLVVEHVNKKPFYKLQYRIDNDLTDIDSFVFTKEMNKRIIFELVDKKSGAHVGDLDTPDGVQASYDDVFGDGDISLRIAASAVYGGYHCVCRIQSLSTVSLIIEQLGFPKDIQEDLRRIAKRRKGLTFFTGGIRTGKNTSAFAIGNDMVGYFNKIVDLSSPIEVLMPFTQIDYRMDPRNLEKAIRLLKKQDVNVVFINEIPDKEVALAMEDLVISGIHVVTTTHIDRLWHLPQKLYKYYKEDYRNIITQMNICVNQRMYVKQCTHCSTRAPVTNLDTKYRDVLEQYYVSYYHVNKGCDSCLNGKLIGGVQPYVERLVFTDEIIDELLQFDKAFQMERHIKKHMFDNQLTLESSLCIAIGEGKLGVGALDSIL
jgi:type II secretory ATPase GspE/PulE/Tfp pilus assembly ATPase PilB-like protein